MTFVVKGKKIKDVSDLPSTVTLTSGADQNPVDVLYDYITNPRYGKGLDHDNNGNYSAGLNIDLDSFKTARTQAAGYYKINGILDTSQDLYANIGEILESMNGLLVFQGGKYILKLQSRSETSVATFTPFEILSPVSVQMPAKGGWDADSGYSGGKPFRLTQMSLNPDNSISITATEYISSIELIP